MNSIGLTMDIEFKLNRSYDFNNLCRSCLRQIVDLNCIFNSNIISNRYLDPESNRRIDNEENVPLRLALIACTQIEVDYNDEMPPKICKECTSEVRRAFNFRQMCIQNDAMLRQYLQQRKTLKEYQLLESTTTSTHIDRKHDRTRQLQNQSTKTNKPPTSDLEIRQQSDSDGVGDHFGDIPDCVSDVDTEQDSKDIFNDSHPDLELIKLENSIDRSTAEANSPSKRLNRSKYSESNQIKLDCFINLESTAKDRRPLTNIPPESSPIRKVKEKTSRFPCDLCSEDFSRKRNMIRHRKNAHDALLICDICNMKFTRKINIRLHMQIHTRNNQQVDSENRRFYCDKCSKDFSSKNVLLRHQRNMHDNTIFTCELCNMKFTRKAFIRLHMRSHIPRIPQRIYTCEICANDLCKVNFNRKNGIKRHMRGHIRKIEAAKNQITKKIIRVNCDICLKGFTRNRDMIKHQRLHEARFICDVCNMKFSRKCNLREHMRSHIKKSEEKFHLCIYCGRTFSARSNLSVHMRRHTGEKPYKCDSCDMAFPRSSDLLSHKRTHTGDKPHLCTVCGKGFAQRKGLIRHVRIHTGERPYKCTYCDRAFTQCNDLALHIRRHTGERPYVCGICNERFIHGTALQVHRKQRNHFEETQPHHLPKTSVNYSKRPSASSNIVVPKELE